MHSLECENNVVGSSVQAHRRQDGVRSHASLLSASQHGALRLPLLRLVLRCCAATQRARLLAKLYPYSVFPSCRITRGYDTMRQWHTTLSMTLCYHFYHYRVCGAMLLRSITTPISGNRVSPVQPCNSI